MVAVSDVLANRIGEHRLYRASPVVSDVPERSVRRPAMAPEMGATWPGHWPRPSRLLATPEPIETVALLAGAVNAPAPEQRLAAAEALRSWQGYPAPPLVVC